MSKVVSSTEAQANFGAILRAAKEGKEEVIVKHYGEPAAVLISYADYEEMLRLRRLEKQRRALAALDEVRRDVQISSPNLAAEDAYRLASFGEDAIRSTLAKDRELAEAGR